VPHPLSPRAARWHPRHSPRCRSGRSAAAPLRASRRAPRAGTPATVPAAGLGAARLRPYVPRAARRALAPPPQSPLPVWAQRGCAPTCLAPRAARWHPRHSPRCRSGRSAAAPLRASRRAPRAGTPATVPAAGLGAARLRPYVPRAARRALAPPPQSPLPVWAQRGCAPTCLAPRAARWHPRHSPRCRSGRSAAAPLRASRRAPRAGTPATVPAAGLGAARLRPYVPRAARRALAPPPQSPLPVWAQRGCAPTCLAPRTSLHTLRFDGIAVQHDPVAPCGFGKVQRLIGAMQE
jgi:hypothetical protein